MKSRYAIWTVMLSIVLAAPTVVFSQDTRNEVPPLGQDAPNEETVETTTEEPPQLPAGRVSPGPTARWKPRRPNFHWYLGVRYDDAPTGIRISRVERNTPAAELGLEAGDYLIAAGGRPVGYYQGRYYGLTDVLDRYADRRGNIRLRYWNFRDGQEEEEDVQLEQR